jgi:hypothetical protein
MSSSATPGERYREGLALLPNWNEHGEEADARYQRGLALITEAAEAGHLAAIKDLADGMAREASFDWSVKLAALGDVGPLLSNITSGDYPDEQSRAVFAAARSGVPWAQLAVGRLYRMGMRDGGGVLIATRDDAFGCLPGAADPQPEGFAWLKRAHAAGWTAATLWLADTLRHEEPVRALEYARAALAGSGPLMPSERVRACKVLAELLDESDAPLAERVTLYTRLAEEGDADAHVWLGDRCRLGEGGAVDLAAARAHYERGADAGSTEAMRELGKMCEAGHAGPVDIDRAVELYKNAAEMGNDALARDRLATRFGLTWYARQSQESGQQ